MAKPRPWATSRQDSHTERSSSTINRLRRLVAHIGSSERIVSAESTSFIPSSVARPGGGGVGLNWVSVFTTIIPFWEKRASAAVTWQCEFSSRHGRTRNRKRHGGLWPID